MWNTTKPYTTLICEDSALMNNRPIWRRLIHLRLRATGDNIDVWLDKVIQYQIPYNHEASNCSATTILACELVS